MNNEAEAQRAVLLKTAVSRYRHWEAAERSVSCRVDESA